jgi:hypothetical protein
LFLKFDAYEALKDDNGGKMTASEGARHVFADKSSCVAASWERPDNIWVETAWTVLEAASDLGDILTIEACQRVIDDGSGGDLPAQSDMNAIFGFLDAHAH